MYGHGLTKEQKWMKFCIHGAALFSTCSKARFFAIVLDTRGRLVGSGYNGSPPGYPHCVDGACPRATEGAVPGTPYDSCISIHAEENALIFSDYNARRGGTLYVNAMPCYGCAKKLAGAGLRRVVCLEESDRVGGMEGVKMLMQCGIRVTIMERKQVAFSVV